MDSVRLIEFRFHCHTLEKEWIERQMMATRKLGEDLVKGMLILLSPIRRREHAEKKHFCTARLDFSDHLVEIVANSGGVDAAQRVVGAKRQDHEIRLIGERPI